MTKRDSGKNQSQASSTLPASDSIIPPLVQSVRGGSDWSASSLDTEYLRGMVNNLRNAHEVFPGNDLYEIPRTDDGVIKGTNIDELSRIAGSLMIGWAKKTAQEGSSLEDEIKSGAQKPSNRDVSTAEFSVVVSTSEHVKSSNYMMLSKKLNEIYKGEEISRMRHFSDNHSSWLTPLQKAKVKLREDLGNLLKLFESDPTGAAHGALTAVFGTVDFAREQYVCLQKGGG